MAYSGFPDVMDKGFIKIGFTEYDFNQKRHNHSASRGNLPLCPPFKPFPSSFLWPIIFSFISLIPPFLSFFISSSYAFPRYLSLAYNILHYFPTPPSVFLLSQVPLSSTAYRVPSSGLPRPPPFLGSPKNHLLNSKHKLKALVMLEQFLTRSGDWPGPRLLP